MRNENGPAADGTAVSAGIGSAERHPDTTTQADTLDLADIRFRRAVALLRSLGDRPLYELFVELGARRMLRTEIEALVYKYAAVDAAVLRAVGGHQFAPLPLHFVGTGQ